MFKLDLRGDITPILQPIIIRSLNLSQYSRSTYGIRKYFFSNSDSFSDASTNFNQNTHFSKNIACLQRSTMVILFKFF